jgi:chondroitin AC lyase
MGQLVFYQPGRVILPNGITISAPLAALVLVKMDGSGISEITVADPSRKLTDLALEIGGKFEGHGPSWLSYANKTGISNLRILLPAGDQAGKSGTVKNHSLEGKAPNFSDQSKPDKQQDTGGSLSGGRYVGEQYGGGIIVWLDETGHHGLIASKNDQHGNVAWRNGRAISPQLYGDHGDRFINAVGDGLFAGERNTTLSISQQTIDNISGLFAAKVCAACRDGAYGDWYLPAKAELDLLFQNKDSVGGFAGDMYWSSSEYNIGFSWGQNFKGYGGQYPLNKGSAYAIRCVRKF